MTAIIVISCIFAYAFIGGAVGKTTCIHLKSKCDECHRAEATKNAVKSYEREKCYSDHMFPAVFAGIGWPLAAPALFGVFAADLRATSADRAERKHERKIKELSAKQALAREQKEKTLADIQFLVENGIKADVAGLYE